MKNLLKNVIVGGILSTIIAIVVYVLQKEGIGLFTFLLNIPLGTIAYVLFKLWTGWLYKHFTFFGRNVVSKYILDMFVWPIVAAGWWAFLMIALH